MAGRSKLNFDPPFGRVACDANIRAVEFRFDQPAVAVSPSK
jgi:hypothetical protein